MNIQQKGLISEIFEVTGLIQVKYPELYKYLSETPLFPAKTSFVNDLSVQDFQQYLDTLQKQFAVFEQTYKQTITF